MSPLRFSLLFLTVLAIGAATLVSGCREEDVTTAGVDPGEAPAAEELVAEPTDLPAVITFNEHVQPILSESCYHCHGPDSSSRAPAEEPLRIDREEFAFAKRESTGRPVIVPGKPDESDLIARIESDDPALMMPPPGPHHHLDEQQIAILRAWIRAGAEYEEHWAFIPPVEPEIPETDPALGEVNNPIDALVIAEYAAHNLAQKPEESPARLCRRLFLDLTGLPPTPTEVKAFVAAHEADADAAIDALLDELFSRPAYGEEQGRRWLDVARYADTHGIHYDNLRSIWPYRDWVVSAFAQNMSWDEFTVEQIAGDLLPEPSLEQVIATGFQRCLPTTGEGGAVPEEYAAIYAQDRVDTMSAAWLGLTTGCAACHDHKFDPLSTRENYQLTAFFRNNTMDPMDRNAADHPPNVFAPLPTDRTRWAEIDAEIAATRESIAARADEARPEFEQWLASYQPGGETAAAPDLLHLALNSFEGVLPIQPNPAQVSANIGRLAVIEGPAGPAPQVVGGDFNLGNLGQLAAADGHSVSLWFRTTGSPSGALVSRMEANADYRGWDVWFEQGRIGGHVIDAWPQRAAKAMTVAAPAPDQWHHLALVYRPLQREEGTDRIEIWIDGIRAEARLTHDGPVENVFPPVPLRLGARTRGSDLDGVLSSPVGLQDLRLYSRPLTEAEITALAGTSLIDALVATPPAQRTPAQVEAAFQHYLAEVDPVGDQHRQRLAALRAEKQQIRQRGAISLVMQERPNSEPVAHVLERGQYANLGERVTPDVPEVLPPLPEGVPANRLGLARWLVDPANPLPARVTMNRLWAQLFGRGLVESTSDFGIMGTRPTHPELLDWLALEFIDSGWDYQHMIRLIVSSATYRQDGATDPVEHEADPDNRWLARGPQYRLEGEQIRDLALAASGLLVDQVGGPPVNPYQPDGVWRAVAMPDSNTRTYEQGHGDDLHRRSLYTIWKRTAPPSSMAIFDAPAREVVCTRRERTNTPLQAFVLWNDPQFLEASRQLAATVLTEHDDFDARLDAITARLIARPLDDEEQAIIRTSFEEVLARYSADAEAAAALVAIGEAPLSESARDLDPAELAAWTMMANTVLNLDETITK